MRWASVENGPDWLDIRSYMKAIEHHHECFITTMLSAVGRSDGATIQVTVAASWVDVGAVNGMGSAAITSQFPNREHKTLEGLVMKLLYQLDHDMTSRRWKQLGLN